MIETSNSLKHLTVRVNHIQDIKVCDAKVQPYKYIYEPLFPFTLNF